jgi:hypothetical protein
MTLYEVFFPEGGVVMEEWLHPHELERATSGDGEFWRWYDVAFYRKHSFFCRLEKWWAQRGKR